MRSRVELFFRFVLLLNFGTYYIYYMHSVTLHGCFLSCFKTVWASEQVVPAMKSQLKHTDEVFLLILPCLISQLFRSVIWAKFQLLPYFHIVNYHFTTEDLILFQSVTVDGCFLLFSFSALTPREPKTSEIVTCDVLSCLFDVSSSFFVSCLSASGSPCHQSTVNPCTMIVL